MLVFLSQYFAPLLLLVFTGEIHQRHIFYLHFGVNYIQQ